MVVLGETECPGARGGSRNVKCSPVRVSIYEPCYSQGDVHGRIRFKRHRNRQNLCDWILGRAGNDVKGKTPALFVALNPIIHKELPVQCESFRLWKRCDKGLKRPPVSSLRTTTAKAYRGAYLPSRPSVIIESGSTCRPIFRARILNPPKAIPATRHIPRMIPASTKMLISVRANPLTSLTGTFWLQVRFVSYLTCASSVSARFAMAPGIFWNSASCCRARFGVG